MQFRIEQDFAFCINFCDWIEKRLQLQIKSAAAGAAEPTKRNETKRNETRKKTRKQHTNIAYVYV